jgi:hypothetical protein
MTKMIQLTLSIISLLIKLRNAILFFIWKHNTIRKSIWIILSNSILLALEEQLWKISLILGNFVVQDINDIL